MKTKTPLVLLAVLVIVVILIAVVASDMQKNGIAKPTAGGGPSADSSTGTTGTDTGAPDTVVSNTVIVTQADNGKTVTVRKGSRFLLKLGEGQWDISISDPSVIARVPNIMVVRGAQGIYDALRAGTTKLSAQGAIDFSVTIKAV